MHSLEDIASNRPHSKEEHWTWLKDQKQKMRPQCGCLEASEKGTEPLFRCATMCKDQLEILNARKELEKRKSKE